jgi:hypothetical protein
MSMYADVIGAAFSVFPIHPKSWACSEEAITYLAVCETQHSLQLHRKNDANSNYLMGQDLKGAVPQLVPRIY